MNEVDEGIEYVEFLFPENDQRLNKFKLFNREKQLNSIHIGSIISEIGEERYIRLKSGENEMEKDRIKQMYQLENNELMEKCRRSETQRQDREREYIRETRDIRNRIRLEVNEQHEQKHEIMNSEISTLKDRCEETMKDRLQLQSDYHTKILFEKEKMERKFNEQREINEKKLDEYRVKLENINNVTNISAKKGQEGENWLYNELVRQFKSAEVLDCHNTSHKGDFTITMGDMKGMVESKNYTPNVSKREIVKFKKDMKSNADFRYGILVSLQSGVANHADLSLEFCDGKPIVYLHDVRDQPFKIKIAYDICQLILKNIDSFDVTKEETQQKLKEMIKSMTARNKRLLCKIEDFSNDMKSEIKAQWEEFGELILHINLDI